MERDIYVGIHRGEYIQKKIPQKKIYTMTGEEVRMIEPR